MHDILIALPPERFATLYRSLDPPLARVGAAILVCHALSARCNVSSSSLSTQAEAEYAVQASALNAAARMANPALFQRLEQMRQAREIPRQ